MTNNNPCKQLWLQVLIPYTNNLDVSSIPIEYEKNFNRSILLTYGTLTDTTIPVRVVLGLLIMKVDSIFPKFPELKPHHQKQFSDMLRTRFFWMGVGLPPL